MGDLIEMSSYEYFSETVFIQEKGWCHSSEINISIIMYSRKETETKASKAAYSS